MFLCQEPPKKEEAIVIQELEAKSLLLLLVFEVTLPLLLLLFSTPRCKERRRLRLRLRYTQPEEWKCYLLALLLSSHFFGDKKREAGKRRPFSVPPFFVSSGNSRGDRLFRGRERGKGRRSWKPFTFLTPFGTFYLIKGKGKGEGKERGEILCQDPSSPRGC